MKNYGKLSVKAKTLKDAMKKARRKLSKKYTITSGMLAIDTGKKVKTYSIWYRLKYAYQKPGKALYRKGKRIR